MINPEGITFNSNNGDLYVIGQPANSMLELTTAGALVQVIDVSPANPKKPSGLAYAPSSADLSKMSIYISDRGIDNDTDSDEIDGEIHEFILSPID